MNDKNENMQKLNVDNEENFINDGVTREINLDELYDGAINNTVVIDPITNDEVLLPSKKRNYPFLGVLLAICVLLVLYYINNKTDIGKTVKDVEPKTTKKTITEPVKSENNTGNLNCTYASKSDSESQNITFTLNYENNILINSSFNYVVISNLDSSSTIIEDLKNQYETFYINNSNITGNTVIFEKNDNGFTFDVETIYNNDTEFDKISVTSGQTILYVKPSPYDTYETLKQAYENNGFTCTIASN